MPNRRGNFIAKPLLNDKSIKNTISKLAAKVLLIFLLMTSHKLLQAKRAKQTKASSQKRVQREMRPT
ncbi:hypothetical protein lacNasYZ01_07630 [Lactobacillus nasalidis]|nr:hypothetical protein lacNasYZ01_07630 [Lactobacillus nasalidis]